MDTDLETLATALYVTADDLLKAHPEILPLRPRVGIAPAITDAEVWSAWCFSDWGSFSSRESIGWRPCQQRNTQMSSRPKWCVR